MKEALPAEGFSWWERMICPTFPKLSDITKCFSKTKLRITTSPRNGKYLLLRLAILIPLNFLLTLLCRRIHWIVNEREEY
jgi:hypothetical protein